VQGEAIQDNLPADAEAPLRRQEMNMLDAQLKTWIAGLDEMVGDTQEEIEKRRKQYSDAVELRRKLAVMREFMQRETVPADVRSAIEACLEWNPHARPK
jgi:hypothetical protein